MDEFGVRCQVTDLLQKLTDSYGVHRIVEFCHQEDLYASAVLELLWEEFLGCSSDLVKRRYIVGILAGLCTNNSYLGLVASRFKDIINECLEAIGSDRNLVKALKSLLKACGEGQISEYQFYRKQLNDALGISEEEQLILQQKQSLLDRIERDRENFKRLRESDWSRPQGEDVIEELLFSYDNLPNILFDFSRAQRNINKFYELNNISPLETTIKERRVIVLVFDDFFFNLKVLTQEPNTQLRHAAQDFDDLTRKIARDYFFYSDLKSFEQPHVAYYQKEDDGCKLSKHNFSKDDLALAIHRRADVTAHKYYRDRAHRYRYSAAFYDDNVDLKEKLASHRYRECRECLESLDKSMANAISSTLRELESLSSEKFTLYVCINEHLSLCLAILLVLRASSIFPSNRIFSTTKYGLAWSVGEVASLENASSEDVMVVGHSRNTRKEALMGKYNYLHCTDPRKLKSQLSSLS